MVWSVSCCVISVDFDTSQTPIAWLKKLQQKYKNLIFPDTVSLPAKTQT